ncbi:hypothetical protein J4Q44_G00204600 [Coregonus suidteri]|uniref:Secreted protein n=1 Tax=Coregonus suidteri TaxID=861788 RepID=A0AAN8LI61_9TELE
MLALRVVTLDALIASVNLSLTFSSDRTPVTLASDYGSTSQWRMCRRHRFDLTPCGRRPWSMSGCGCLTSPLLCCLMSFTADGDGRVPRDCWQMSVIMAGGSSMWGPPVGGLTALSSWIRDCTSSLSGLPTLAPPLCNRSRPLFSLQC